MTDPTPPRPHWIDCDHRSMSMGDNSHCLDCGANSMRVIVGLLKQRDKVEAKLQRRQQEIDRLTQLFQAAREQDTQFVNALRDRDEQQQQEIARLRQALQKVRAHTAYVHPTYGTLEDLLKGLLQSVERITDAALALPAPSKED